MHPVVSIVETRTAQSGFCKKDCKSTDFRTGFGVPKCSSVGYLLIRHSGQHQERQWHRFLKKDPTDRFRRSADGVHASSQEVGQYASGPLSFRVLGVILVNLRVVCRERFGDLLLELFRRELELLLRDHQFLLGLQRIRKDTLNSVSYIIYQS